MKKFSLSKTMLGVAIVCSSLTVANAQWSVQDVNSNAIKGTLEDLLDGVKTQITNQDAAQSAMEVMSKQQSVQLEEADKRNRGNISLADTIKRDRDAMPTLQQCIDLSRGSGGGAAGSSAARGGGGSGPSSADKEIALKNKIKSDTARSIAVVAGIKESSSCGLSEMEQASKFCSGGSSSGAGSSMYPGANTSPRSLLGNFKGNKSRAFNNFTINDEARKAADQYLITAISNYMPPTLDATTTKYNESYVASYLRVTNGLTTARDAMNVVSNFYSEIVPSSSEGAAERSAKWDGSSIKTFWESDDMKNVYDKLKMERPEIPSLTELYMAEIHQDYYMLKEKKDTDSSEIENLREMNRKMSLANFLTFREIQLQEYQTILLAQLLTQAVLPEAERLTTTAGEINAKK